MVGQEEGSAEEIPTISGVLYLAGHSLYPFPHTQDVDIRDRRRRELQLLEPPEPHELPVWSPSWWPVSSAERKRNITLVRVGQTWCSRWDSRWWASWEADLLSLHGQTPGAD